MITDLHSGDTYVSRLRIQGAVGEPMLAQLRAANLLNGINLPTPTSSTIVFIRKLRDPMPGVLRLDQSGGHLPPGWNQALTDSFSRLVSNAARPALRAVTGNEEAIIFMDRSELLACIATDLCNGMLASRWWWRLLLKRGNVSQIVRVLWQDKPEYIPAAVRHLSAKAGLGNLGSLFTASEAHQLTLSVARSFALNALRPVLTIALDETSLLNARVDAPRLPRLVRGETEATDMRSPGPWHRWFAEGEASRLAPEQQRFFGIALMLQHEPARARTQKFARELERWQQQLTSLFSDRGVSLQERGPGSVISASEVPFSDAPPRKTEPVTSLQERAVPERSVNQETKSSAPKTLSSELAEIPSVDLVALTGPGDLKSELTHLAQATEEVLAPRFTETASSEAAKVIERPPQPPEAPLVSAKENEELAVTTVRTELGGFFYLINLGLYLNLFGDFTRPAEPGIDLSIWDFLTLVGNEMIENQFSDDPIWTLLSDLAGRSPETLPGKDFEPPNQWRLAPEWLDSFADNSCQWSAIDGRLRILHKSGFLVIDLSLESSDPTQQLEREIRRYENLPAPLFLSASPESSALNQNLAPQSLLRIWLARLMPYLLARLCQALGVRQIDLSRLLCRHAARVIVTATHLEVMFALAELPIEIRLAGLDRDPGWVPSAGRFVNFHFE